MDQGVYVALDLSFEMGDAQAFRRAPLLPQRDRLRGLGDFDSIDTSDDDLLGEGNALGPAATVADLLALLRREAYEGEQFFSVEHGESHLRVQGFLSSWSAYREHRLPLIFTATAAEASGGRGSLSLLGEVDGEIVTILVDVDAGSVRVASVDPQNLTEGDWNVRLGGMSALDEARHKWAKKAKRAVRHRR